MKSFNQYFLDKEYAQVEKLGDKLAWIAATLWSPDKKH
jgi:hypothetical protein